MRAYINNLLDRFLNHRKIAVPLFAIPITIGGIYIIGAGPVESVFLIIGALYICVKAWRAK